MSQLGSIELPKISLYGLTPYDKANYTVIVIPEGVTTIGYWAFYDCTGLTNVTIPSSVTTIANSAFNRCTGLTNITIPDGVTSIGSYTFYGCTGLTSITIPSNVTSIGSYTFDGCAALTNIYVDQAQNDTLFSNAGLPAGCAITWDSTGPESHRLSNILEATFGWLRFCLYVDIRKKCPIGARILYMIKKLPLLFIVLCMTVSILGARTQLPPDFKEESPVTVEPFEPLPDKGSFMLSVQIPSFSYNFAGIDFYALHDTAGIEPFRMSSPLPSTAVSFTWSPDDRFSFGGKVRFATERYAPEFCPIPGRRSVLCADLFATAGILSTPLPFDDENCIMLLEASLLLGASWRTNYDWSTVCPSLGLSAGVHLGREYITMAFGVEATAALDIIGPVDERTVMFSLRPNISLVWRWL